MKIMTTTYILGSFLLWMPTILVNLAKQDGSYVKYAIAAIFTMLCERTAGMLSNLMNAEEQEFTKTNGSVCFAGSRITVMS